MEECTVTQAHVVHEKAIEEMKKDETYGKFRHSTDNMSAPAGGEEIYE